MWQTIGCNSFPPDDGLVATWQQGKYDNLFIREGDRWRFKRFRWLCNFRTAFDQGWVKQPLLHIDPLDLSRFPEKLWPSRDGAPYPPFDPASPMDFGPPEP